MIVLIDTLLVFMHTQIIILMDKLKEIMALKKPKDKITIQKSVLQNQK